MSHGSVAWQCLLREAEHFGLLLHLFVVLRSELRGERVQRLSRRLRFLPTVPLEMIPQRSLQIAEWATQRLAKVAVLHERRLRRDQQVRLCLRELLEDLVQKRARPVQCLLRSRFMGSPHEFHRIEHDSWRRRRSSYGVSVW